LINNKKSLQILLKKSLNDFKVAVLEFIFLVNAKPEIWIERLDSAEPDIQIFAAQLIGEKKINKAIFKLSNLLSDPKEQVAEAAADALKKIADIKSVPLIIKSIRRGDLRSEVRAIETMGHIGGDEAKAYLEMMALGHESKEVQNISLRLLELKTDHQ